MMAIFTALALLLSLSACGAEGAERAEESGDATAPEALAASGRYLESEITPEALREGESYLNQIYAWEDGSVDVFGACIPEGGDPSACWFHSEDEGAHWEEQALPEGWERKSEIFLDSGGGLYAYGYEDEHTMTLSYALPDGGSGSVSVTEEEFGNGNIALADGGIYLSEIQDYPDGLTLMATDARTGELLWSKVYEDWTTKWTLIANQTVYVTNGAQYSQKLDVRTGEILEDHVSQDYMLPVQSLYAEEQFYFFLDSDGNICRGVFGQEQKEIVLEAGEFRYGVEWMTTAGGIAFAISPEGTIYLYVAERLYVYRFDSEAHYGGTTLTVWALEDSPTLRQAVLLFRESHPEAEVRVEVQEVTDKAVLENGGNGQTRDDLLTALNTKLLAGEGPDVLLLDGLNYQSYMEKGVLADLTELYEGKAFIGETVSALLDDSGKCYVLPARFTTPVMLTEKTPPDTLDALTAAVRGAGAKRLSELEEDGPDGGDSGERPYLDMESDELRDLLWATSAPALLKDSGVQEEALREWLSTLKTLWDYYGYDGFYGGMSVGQEDEFQYGNRQVMLTSSLYEWARGNSISDGMNLDSIEAIPTALTWNGQERGHIQLAPFPGLSKGTYTPKVLLAVNAASREQELAKALVAQMLDMEVQQYTYGDGLPVLREAVKRQTEFFSEPFAKIEGGGAALETLLEGCTTPVLVPDSMWEAVQEASERYVLGETTLEEAVGSVREALSLQLMEQ